MVDHREKVEAIPNPKLTKGLLPSLPEQQTHH